MIYFTITCGYILVALLSYRPILPWTNEIVENALEDEELKKIVTILEVRFGRTLASVMAIAFAVFWPVGLPFSWWLARDIRNNYTNVDE